jgi:hypothetical protein
MTKILTFVKIFKIFKLLNYLKIRLLFSLRYRKKFVFIINYNYLLSISRILLSHY